MTLPPMARGAPEDAALTARRDQLRGRPDRRPGVSLGVRAGRDGAAAAAVGAAVGGAHVRHDAPGWQDGELRLVQVGLVEDVRNLPRLA